MPRLITIAAAAFVALAALPAFAADAGNGKALFQKCGNCHGEQATGTDVGPNLKGVFGRKAAALDDFRYSAAMRRSDIVWDEANLKAYIANPQAKVKGNRMPFTGYAKPTDVDDIVEFLKTYK